MRSPDIFTLIEISCFFLGCNIVLMILMVQYRKYRGKRLSNLEAVFADCVSSYLYPRPGEQITSADIGEALSKAGVKKCFPGNIDYLIQLMIRTQRALGGVNHHKIKKLYSEIPPYGVSIAKVRSKKWSVKARGIREIYEMDQPQYLKEIVPYYNHKNIYVRREAQIALVVFLGWESLSFLPMLTRRVGLWQQIKIVEKLHDVDKSYNIGYLRNCYKSSNPDVLQLVIRIIKKYQIMSETDFLEKMLCHDDYEVREAAIYCLLSLGVKNPEMRRLLYSLRTTIPSEIQQTQVLKYLYKNQDFILNHPEFVIGLNRSA